MAAGKNKIMRWARMHIGAVDLSGDSRALAGLDNHYAPLDLAGWANPVHYKASDGQRVVGVRGYQAFLNDTAVTGAWAALKQATATSRQLSLLFGSGAEPSLGDPAYMLAGVQISDPASMPGNLAVISADFYNDQAQYSAQADNPWGVVLQALVSLTVTTTGTGVDNGAASILGGHANLHVEASSGGSWVFKVQHSTDNSSWADLITFTATGAAVASEHKTVSGTVNRYLRALSTRTSGTVSIVMDFARN